MNDAEIRGLWSEVSRRLEAQDSLVRAERDARLNLAAARSSRLTIVGQAAQLVFGLVILLFVGGLWATLPKAPVLLVCGALLHLYGIATIAMAARAIARIRKIDFDQPLVSSQFSLERAEEALVQSRMVAGQPWWFLWIAVPVVALGKAGTAFSSNGAAMVMIMLGVTALGMVATLALRARLIRSGLISNPIGQQLAASRRRLEEIRRFADEANARPGPSQS